MKKLFLISLAASGMLATSCQDYDPWDGDVAKYEYRKDFLNTFGNIDPNHTWNTAEQRTMEFKINVPGTFNLRIFTTEPRVASAESELLAYYKNDGMGYEGCTGQSYTISFDCPSGLKKVFADIEYIGDGHHIMLPVTLDAEGHGLVEFGKMGTRGESHVAENKGSGRAEYIYKAANDMHFTRAAYDGGQGGFLDLIPENVENTNKEHVSVDFSYVSTGAPLNLYPMYTWTGANVTIGLQYKANHSANWPDYNEEEQKIWTTTNSETGRITRHFSNNTTDGGRSNYYWCTDYTTDGFDYTICPGITIDLPAGYEFRFWVLQKYGANNSQSFIRYSTTKDNSDRLHYFGTFNNGHKHDDGAGNKSDVLYLGVEDWNNSRHDINDIVMAFVGELPLVIEDVTMIYNEAEYVIAYEDMGAIGDYDFNDVVFSVRHVSGATLAEVDLRAVGGTLPVRLKYNGNYLFGGKELHEVLGEIQEPKITDMRPINVGGSGKTVNRTNMYFVEEEESVSISSGRSIVDEASKFSLEVEREGGPEDGKYIEIKAPDPNKDGSNANVPQAIIVAKHNWDWATEGTRIDHAYSAFTTWVNNAKASNWYSPIWSGEDEHSTTIDYGVTLMPSYAYEKCLLNRDDIDIKEEEVGAGNAYTLVIPKTDLVITHFNEDGNAEVHHNLWEYDSFNLAFVVTGRQSGETVTLKVYKNSVSNGNEIETITFDDTHHNSTTSSSFGESLSQEVNINWSGVNQIVVAVEQHPTNCHLNSIWTAMPEKDFHVMPLSSIATTIPNEGDQASIALTFVASAQHVMDFTNGNNGWRSFSNYAVMLSQIENAGRMDNSPILYKLVRKSEAGHYMLKNPRGGYLKAPTANNQAHEWTNTESEAADLVIEACPNITLMQGCSHENAVSIKTTVGNTTYYFSANKPAMWRTGANDYQKAIYLFHWEGNH